MYSTNRLKKQTHIDIESGTALRITSKPPVNDKFKNVVLQGRTSKNYIQIKTTATINGITYTSNSNGTYTLNGTATDLSKFNLLGVDGAGVLLSTGDYILSGCPSGGGSAYAIIGAVANSSNVNLRFFSDLGSGRSVTIADGERIWIRIQIASGTVMNNIVFKPMFRLASTSADFEPYGITPSSFNLTSCGKNFCDGIFELGSINTTTGLNEASPGFYRLLNYNAVRPNETYRMSSLNDYPFRVFYYDNNKVYIGTEDTAFTQKLLTSPLNCYYVRFRIGSENLSSQIQLELGTAKTAYRSFVGATQQINVKDVDDNLYELCNLPDGTEDEFNKNKIIKKVKILTVTSGTSPYQWSYSGSDNSTYIQMFCLDTTNIYPQYLGITTNGYCNSFPVAESGVNTVRFSRSASGTYIYIRIPYSIDISLTNAGMQNWINAQIAAHGNIVFRYEYATQQIYDTESTEAAKLNNINTYQYETNIFTDAAVPPTIQGECRKLGNRPYVEQNFYLSNGEQFYLSDNTPLTIFI